MKNKNIISIALMVLLMIPAVSLATWTPFYDISSNHFYYTASSNITVITLDTDFHSCGNNKLGNLKSSDVGSEAYKTISAVFLSAVMSNRQVALNYDGCVGSRAKIVGIRIGD